MKLGRAVAGFAVFAGAIYWRWLRRPVLTWGAKAAEADGRLSGDELLEHAEHERREQEAALETSRARAELVTQLGRTLRTPLTSVLGFTRLALDQGTVPPRERVWIENVRLAGHELLHQIDDLLGAELELPVFLYGILAAGSSRAALRRGGPTDLEARIASGELVPDFGPRRLHPTSGAVLVAARPPLVAFNLELAPPATRDDAKAIAAQIREGGPEGLPGVRAIGLWLEEGQVAQVSTNVEDHHSTRLADVVAAVARHARPARAELVGLAPRAAFYGFPEDLPVRNKRLIEDALTNVDAEAH